MKSKLILIFSLIILIFILILVRFFVSKPPTPTVKSTVPANNAELILDNTPLTITFANPLSSNQQAQTTVTAEPSATFQLTWPSPDQLLVTPTNFFTKDTRYTITISFDQNSIPSFSFTTNFYSSLELEEQGREQIADDLIFGQTWTEFIKQNPWYKSLPIETKTYRIIYDFEKKSFRIRLLITPSPTERQTIVQQALNDLEKIGVNLKETSYTVLEPTPSP